ncbi:hypothetical protein Tco_0327786 [Tanacetum coccineum]
MMDLRPGLWNERVDIMRSLMLMSYPLFMSMVVWIDKEGRQKDFSISKVWEAVRTDYPKVNCMIQVLGLKVKQQVFNGFCVLGSISCSWAMTVMAAWSHEGTGLWDCNKDYLDDKFLEEWIANWWDKDVLFEYLFYPRFHVCLFVSEISFYWEGHICFSLGDRLDGLMFWIGSGLDRCVSQLERAERGAFHACEITPDHNILEEYQGNDLLTLLAPLVWRVLGESCTLFSLTMVFPIGFYMGGFFKKTISLGIAITNPLLVHDGSMFSKDSACWFLLTDGYNKVIRITCYVVH